MNNTSDLSKWITSAISETSAEEVTLYVLLRGALSAWELCSTVKWYTETGDLVVCQKLQTIGVSDVDSVFQKILNRGWVSQVLHPELGAGIKLGSVTKGKVEWLADAAPEEKKPSEALADLLRSSATNVTARTEVRAPQPQSKPALPSLARFPAVLPGNIKADEVLTENQIGYRLAMIMNDLHVQQYGIKAPGCVGKIPIQISKQGILVWKACSGNYERAVQYITYCFENWHTLAAECKVTDAPRPPWGLLSHTGFATRILGKMDAPASQVKSGDRASTTNWSEETDGW